MQESIRDNESQQPLLTPVKLGRYELPNRVVMAPMTRSRAYNRDRAPTDLHVEYYAQRATAGLIVSEGAQISPQGVGYVYTPGMHSAAQLRGWKKVTTAVHARGGHIFGQLWHAGYVSHPDFHGGALPVAPSAVNPRGRALTPNGLKDTVTPHALERGEIKAVVQDFVRAASNAMEAGFDGIEIHGANGYLIEQFLRGSSNHRSDEYGGDIPNRARFLFEIVEGITDAIGADHTAVRLSPANTQHVPPDSDTRALYDFVIGALSSYGFAYLHLREPEGDVSGIPNMVLHVAEHYRTVYHGTLIASTGYTQETGNDVIARNVADLVAYGKAFVANPDLVERFRTHAALTEPDRNTFFQGGAHGYTDYPQLCAEAA